MAAPLTAEQVLDKQFKILCLWKTDYGQQFGHNFTESLLGEKAAERYNIAKHQAYLLDHAETFQATHDMSLQIEMAAQQLPDGVSLPLSLPIVPNGFLWLDRPVTVQDIHDVDFDIRAVVWDTHTIIANPDDGTQEQAISLHYYADNDPTLGKLLAEVRGGMPPLVDPTLFHMNAVLPSDPLPLTATMERFMISFWSLIRQPLVLNRQAKSSRPFARRFERASFQPRDITIVDLRQAFSTPPLGEKAEPTGNQFSWRFRYPVTGHWKRQYYPTLGDPRLPDGSWNEDSHRYIYIDEFYKGPEDAPVYSKDRIFRVRR